MIDNLPLWPSGRPYLPVEVTPRRPLNPACAECPRGAKARSVCMSADGTPGGLLAVYDAPTLDDDRRGRPLSSESGAYLRKLVAELWAAPVVWDNGVKCAGGSPDVEDVNACRPYMAEVLTVAKPTRIVCFGSTAARAVTGRAPSQLSAWRAYTFTSTGVPVYFMPSPVLVMRNRFLRRRFEDTLRWALASPAVQPPRVDGFVASLVHTTAEAVEAVTALRASNSVVTFDIEAAGKQFFNNYRVLSCAVHAKGSDRVFVWTKDALQRRGVFGPLGDLLTDPAVGKKAQNGKYDCLGIRWWAKLRGFGDIVVGPLVGDSLFARKVLDADADADLDTMGELVGRGGHKGEAQAALAEVRKEFQFAARVRKKPSAAAEETKARLAELGTTAEEARAEPMRYAYAFVPDTVLYRYNAMDSLVTSELLDHFEPDLAIEPARTVYKDFMLRAHNAFVQAQWWGIHVDYAAMGRFVEFVKLRTAELHGQLEAAGLSNPNSPAAVGDYLYKRLGLKVPFTTDSGAPSTDKDALHALEGKHPIVSVLSEFRRIGRLSSSYDMRQYVGADSRIHPSYNITGAESGRLSLSDPALHGIPRGSTAEGKMIRNTFTASPGCVLVSADYSQIELRVAAKLSGDIGMREDFSSGRDTHLETAKLIAPSFNIDPATLTKDHPLRTSAKSVVFGLLYGQSDKALADKLGITVKDAAKLRAQIYSKRQRLKAWIDECVTNTRRTGETWTDWQGSRLRRRPLWRIGDADEYTASHAERAAYNTAVQGTANDYCLLAACETTDWILEERVPAKVVLSWHDALVLDVREDALEEVTSVLPAIMTSFPCGGVPLDVEVKVGYTLGSLGE